MVAAAALKALLIRRNTAFLHSAGYGVRRARGTASVVVAAPRYKLLLFMGGFTLSYQCRRNFGIGATTGSENPVSIESPLMESMEKKIKEHLSAESVFVKDAYGDGRHVSIEVISSAFDGQSAVNRQMMVYKAIWEELRDRVHAVDQMTTRTPSEAASSWKIGFLVLTGTRQHIVEEKAKT